MRATPRRRPCRHCRNEPGELVPELRDVVRAIYDDNVRYVDQQMGRFLEALQDEDLYDESVIAFVSDHGEALWDHDGQLAHGRTNLYDELVHVPLIVKPAAGARWARGRVVEAQVRLFDLAPTLLELAGIEVPSEAEGARSLAPALRADGPSLRDRPAFSAAENDKALSLRHDGFKYIRHFPDGLAPGAAGAEALYDLREDPAEHRDVAADRPQVLARMRLAVDELLTTAEKEHGPTGGADLDPVDARQLEALRALGYIE